MNIAGNIYGDGEFCLDFAIDYCAEGGRPSADLAAIVSDAALATTSAASMFGTW